MYVSHATYRCWPCFSLSYLIISKIESKSYCRVREIWFFEISISYVNRYIQTRIFDLTFLEQRSNEPVYATGIAPKKENANICTALLPPTLYFFISLLFFKSNCRLLDSCRRTAGSSQFAQTSEFKRCDTVDVV